MVMLENSNKIVFRSVVSPSGVFMCNIDGYFNVLHATMAVLANNWGVSGGSKVMYCIVANVHHRVTK